MLHYTSPSDQTGPFSEDVLLESLVGGCWETVEREGERPQTFIIQLHEKEESYRSSALDAIPILRDTDLIPAFYWIGKVHMLIGRI